MSHDLQKTQYIIFVFLQIFGHFEFFIFWIDTSLRMKDHFKNNRRPKVFIFKKIEILKSKIRAV